MKKRMRVNIVVLSFVLCLVALSIAAVSSAPINASLVADRHADKRADLALQLGDKVPTAETLNVGEDEIVARGRSDTFLTGAGKALDDSTGALGAPSLTPLPSEANPTNPSLLHQPWLMHGPSPQSSRFSSMPPPASLPHPTISSAQASNDAMRLQTPLSHMGSSSNTGTLQSLIDQSLKRSFAEAGLNTPAAKQPTKKIMDPNGPSFHLAALFSGKSHAAVHGGGSSTARPIPQAPLRMERTRTADTSKVPQALPRAIDPKRVHGARDDKAMNQLDSSTSTMSESREARNARAAPTVLTPVQQVMRDSPLTKSTDRATFYSSDGRQSWQDDQRGSQRHSEVKKAANQALGQPKRRRVGPTKPERALRDSEFADDFDVAEINSGDTKRSSMALKRVRDRLEEGRAVRIVSSQHRLGSGTSSIDPPFARLPEDNLPTSPYLAVQSNVHRESQGFHQAAASSSGAQQTPHGGSAHPHAPPSTPNFWDQFPDIADLS